MPADRTFDSPRSNTHCARSCSSGARPGLNDPRPGAHQPGPRKHHSGDPLAGRSLIFTTAGPPGQQLTAPESGTITSWQLYTNEVSAESSVQLRVLSHSQPRNTKSSVRDQCSRSMRFQPPSRKKTPSTPSRSAFRSPPGRWSGSPSSRKARPGRRPRFPRSKEWAGDTPALPACRALRSPMAKAPQHRRSPTNGSPSPLKSVEPEARAVASAVSAPGLPRPGVRGRVPPPRQEEVQEGQAAQARQVREEAQEEASAQVALADPLNRRHWLVSQIHVHTSLRRWSSSGAIAHAAKHRSSEAV